MTDLAVTIYDTGNAIIGIKTMLVRYLSPCLASLSLGTSQPHGSVPSKSLKRDTAGNWHKNKPREIKQLVPKHGRQTVLP